MSENKKKNALFFYNSYLIMHHATRFTNCIFEKDKEGANLCLEEIEGTVKLLKIRVNESEGEV